MLIDIASFHGFTSNSPTKLNEKAKHPGVLIQFVDKLLFSYSHIVLKKVLSLWNYHRPV